MIYEALYTFQSSLLYPTASNLHTDDEVGRSANVPTNQIQKMRGTEREESLVRENRNKSYLSCFRFDLGKWGCFIVKAGNSLPLLHKARR